MANLKSELEITCPCCRSTLVVDTNLRRLVSCREPERGDKPELDAAAKILAAEKGRGDALARRFEEALRQAENEPVTKPMRDFDLD
jgi:hypothetical protein